MVIVVLAGPPFVRLTDSSNNCNVPLIDMIDIDAEITRLLAELKHKESFLQGIVKKLSNEKFVNNAPAAVIELERKKQADAESIIRSLKESLTILLKK